MNLRTKALIDQYVGSDVWLQGKLRAKELVANTRRLEDQFSTVQWAWGDLALEVVPPGLGSKLISPFLDAFEEDYEFPWSHYTLLNLRRVCVSFPRDKRCKASFNAHRELAYHPDRFELMRDELSRKEAMQLAGNRPATHVAKHLTAIACANASASWARSCYRRLEAESSDDLLNAISDAWRELTKVAERTGIIQTLLDEQIQAFEYVEA